MCLCWYFFLCFDRFFHTNYIVHHPDGRARLIYSIEYNMIWRKSGLIEIFDFQNNQLASNVHGPLHPSESIKLEPIQFENSGKQCQQFIWYLKKKYFFDLYIECIFCLSFSRRYFKDRTWSLIRKQIWYNRK